MWDQIEKEGSDPCSQWLIGHVGGGRTPLDTDLERGQ